MSDPRLLRAIVAEVRRARRALDSLEAIEAGVARFAVKLEELPVLRAADAIRPLVEVTAMGDRIASAVNHLERVPEEAVLPASAGHAADWREWLRPAAAQGGTGATAGDEVQRARPGQAPVTTGPENTRRADAAGMAAGAGMVRHRAGLSASGPPPQIHSRKEDSSAPGAAAARAQEEDPVTAQFQPSSVDTSASRLPEESNERPAFPALMITAARAGTTPVWVAPAVHHDGISRRLLSAVERAERARRERLGPLLWRARRPDPIASGAEEREPGQPRAMTPLESVALRSGLPPAAGAESRPRSPVPSGTGLRRLASLASVSITHGGPHGLEGSAPPTPRSSTSWNSPGRPARGTVEDFAAQLLDTLRAEAERHGIDPEGPIR